MDFASSLFFSGGTDALTLPNRCAPKYIIFELEQQSQPDVCTLQAKAPFSRELSELSLQ